MLKKPMTTEEYFDKVCGILKEKGMMQDILNYGLATSTYCKLFLKQDFNPKAVSKLMGHAKELITMDIYGDNANIIPEEIPELLSYMAEVMPEKSNDAGVENDALDTVIDMDKFLLLEEVAEDK